jgi:acyl-coenzyme A thioesterase PaaI-like protein
LSSERAVKGGGSASAPPKLTVPELERLLAAEFPQALVAHPGVVIEAVQHRGSRLRQMFQESSLRPGGTISGAALMALGDFAMYVAVLASIGWVPLAVTTQMSIDFLNKPPPRDLVAECRLLKLSKRRAMGTVTIVSEVEAEPVAHVTATYSIPPGAWAGPGA